jgi:pimeloyl-ACP methyl ester carboxylesterase
VALAVGRDGRIRERGPETWSRSRPDRAGPVDDFIRQSNAVIAHDVEAQLGRIAVPTLITIGRHDQVTSLRFADRLKKAIRDSELLIFDGCAHAPLYESTDEFNQKTLAFVQRHTGSAIV